MATQAEIRAADKSGSLLGLYERMLKAYGRQHWWPGESAFEVMVGAVLTQGTAWANAAKAIANLKQRDALSPRALRDLPEGELSRLLHPSGYHDVKARKLKALAAWLAETCSDDILRLLCTPTDDLRQRLLSVWGIGPETADSILLYALGRPAFVVDTYTRRILSRLGFDVPAAYEDLCRWLEARLPRDAALYADFHALLVRHAKEACRSRPLCSRCCLRDACTTASG